MRYTVSAIRPYGVFQVKEAPKIINDDKMYFFNHHNVGYFKLFGEDVVGVNISFLVICTYVNGRIQIYFDG